MVLLLITFLEKNVSLYITNCKVEDEVGHLICLEMDVMVVKIHELP